MLNDFRKVSSISFGMLAENVVESLLHWLFMEHISKMSCFSFGMDVVKSERYNGKNPAVDDVWFEKPALNAISA